MKLSKKSWHYRLATKYSDNYYHDDVDFCEYTYDVGSGALLVLLIIAAMSFWLGGLLDAAIWLYVVLSNNLNMPISGYGFTTVLVTLSGCAVTGVGYVCLKLNERLAARKLGLVPSISQPDTFFTLLSRQFRNRVCFKVELID